MNLDQLKKLWVLSFDDSADFVDLFFSTAYSPQRCQVLEEDGLVLAALYWLDGEYAAQKYAYIYGVATHPDHRGKGLCRKLMEKTRTALQAQGYAGALLMPAQSELRRMYEKMGYRDCTTISEFVCTAGDTPTAVHSISIEEYAALRRRYLPEGGLIQEGENLTYLASYAGLYAGEGFVMAAVQGSMLFIIEFLGDKTCAPGILRAMGYETGLFRTPGDEFPFAMYFPLQKDAPVPSYLGHAFD